MSYSCCNSCNDKSNSSYLKNKSSSFFKYGYHPCIIKTNVRIYNANFNNYYTPSSKSYYGNFRPCYSVNNNGYSYYS